jgi:hypothetical protein
MADYSRAARVRRYLALPAADPTGNAGHGAKPRRSCSAITPSRHAGSRPRWVDCKPQRVLLLSCLVLCDLATPTANLSRDLCSGGAAGATRLRARTRNTRRRGLLTWMEHDSVTSEADHVTVGDTLTSDYLRISADQGQSTVCQ